jgi:hypothetical protein
MAYELLSNTFTMPDANYECLFMGTHSTTATMNAAVYCLFHNKITNIDYMYIIRTSFMGVPSLAEVQTLAPASSGKLMSATMWATNEKTAEIIYFVNNNKLYYYGISDATENEINVQGLPLDETITYVSNRHYSLAAAPAFDYFAIATYKEGKYKLFMYNMVGGLPNGDPVYSATGSGKVKQVQYLAPNYSYSDNFFWARDYSR